MPLLDILGGISSISGLLGASAAQRRARMEFENALNEQYRNVDAGYQDSLGANRKELMGAAGYGADAVKAMGAQLGDSLAGAGVYNSSATAGAIGKANTDQQAALLQLAARLQGQASQQKAQGLQSIGQQKMGYLSGNMQQAQSNLSSAQQGFGSYLGGLVQRNLMNSGANQYRNQLTNVNGTTGQAKGLDASMHPFQTLSPITGTGLSSAQDPFDALRRQYGNPTR